MKMGEWIVIPIIIGVLAVIAVIVISNDNPINNESTIPIEPEISEKLEEIEEKSKENQYNPADREWLTSGPFQIDRSKYLLGEKIFLVIGGISLEEKGQIVFLRPLNLTHFDVYLTIPFDGEKKNTFNYYLQPQLSKINGFCTVDDFVGEWRVVFRGTDYPNLEFEITDEILPGDEDSYQPVC